MDLPNHSFNDEELRCLIEARRIFHNNGKGDKCSECERAWNLIDQAILARYTLLARDSKKEKEDG